MMFISGEPSNAQRALRDIAKASGGLAPKDVAPKSGGFPAIHIRTYVINSLQAAGWITSSNCGPRGATRLFITEMGQHVLDMIDKDGMHYVRSLWLAYPEMLAEMRKLGIDPEESF